MNGRLRICLTGLLGLAALLSASIAFAGACTVSSSGVAFGRINPLTMDAVESTGSVFVNCTDVSFYSVALSTGSGTYSQRRMVDGAYRLFYNLYLDPAYQQIWGDGTSSTFVAPGNNPVNGVNNLHTIYGRIPVSIQRDVHVGSYADTITVVVSF